MYKYDVDNGCQNDSEYISLLEDIVSYYDAQIYELRKGLIKNIRKIGD